MTRRTGLALGIAALVLVLGATVAPQTERASAGAPCVGPIVSGSSYVLFPTPPLVIPDNDPGGVDACVVITSSLAITDLDVGLIITHRWPGDLIITLEHQDTGTMVTLIDRPGVPATGIGCGQAGDDITVVLSDEAAAAVENTCEPTTPTINGVLRPNEPLSDFDGESIGGTWILHLRDAAISDVGSLVAVSLTVSPAGASGDADCSGTVDSIDAALVLQYGAGLLQTLPCQAAADADASGTINSIDAALILQLTAGLLPSLPP